MYKKITKTIHLKCACIQPAFSAFRTQLTGKPSKYTILPSVKFWSRNNIKVLYLICISTWFRPLNDMGIHRSLYTYIYACHMPHIQANRNIQPMKYEMPPNVLCTYNTHYVIISALSFGTNLLVVLQQGSRHNTILIPLLWNK